MDHQQREVSEERSSVVTKTTKSVRVVQHSSESVESSHGEVYSNEGSPVTSRKEIRSLTQMQKIFNNSGEFLFNPLLALGERFSGKETDFEDVSSQASSLVKHDTFEMQLDVTEYSPENIQVKVLDDVVMITGKQEIKINENNFKSRSFSKKFSIPPDVVPETIKCSLSKDGKLKISAPRTNQRSTNVTQRDNSQTSVTSTTTNTSDTSRTQSSNAISPRNVNTTCQGQELGTFNDGKTFTVRVDVKLFKAEELNISITSSMVKVEGKHESEFASRLFYKEFTLVTGVETTKIQCTLSTDGILTITAPINTSPASGQEVTEVRQEKRVTETQQIHSTGRGQTPPVEPKRPNASQEVTKQTQQITQQKEVTQQHQEVRQQTQEVRQQTQEVRQEKREVTQQEAVQQKQVTQQEVVQQQQVTQQQQNVTQQRQEITHEVRKPEEPVQDTRKPEPQAAPHGKPAPEQHRPSPPKTVQPHQSPASKEPTAVPSEPETERSVVPVQTLANPEPCPTSASPADGPNAINQVNDGKTLKVRVNVSEYRREEITVRIVKRIIIVEGNHEDDQGSRSFLKKIPLPAGTEPSDVTSGLAPNGVLLVNAPVKPDSNAPVSPNTKETSPKPNVTSDKNVTKTHEIQQQETRKEETLDEEFEVVPNPEPESEPTSPDADEEGSPKEISHAITEDKFQLVLDVSKYTRKEVIVKVSTTTIRIEGKQKKEFSSRSFFKECPIPDSVEPTNVRSTFTPEGHLNITAPVGKGPQPAGPAPRAPTSDTDFSIVDVTDTDESVTPAQQPGSVEEPHTPQVVNDGQTFKVTINVKEYRREEIRIRVKRTVIRIEGRKEAEYITGRKVGQHESQFTKEVPIPDGVDPKSITSTVSNDGVLTITAKVTKVTTTQQQTSVTQQKNVTTEQTKQEALNTVSQKEIKQSAQTQNQQNTTTQKTTTSQKTTMLKTTLDLNAAKETIDGAVRDIDRNEKTFTMVYDVSGYNAEDLTIRITKYVVTVEGKQSTEFSSRSFVKKFSIPQGVNPTDFQPSLTAEGILTFSAPIDHSK